MQEALVSEICRPEPKVFATNRTIDGKAVVEHLSTAAVADEGEVVGDAPVVNQPQAGVLKQMLDKLLGDSPRNARNVRKFEPHMIEHGFSGLDHNMDAQKLAEMKHPWRIRTPQQQRARSAPTAQDFLQLRSSLKVAWIQTNKRKWRSFISEAENSARFRYGSEPQAPERHCSPCLSRL
ncbi:hypothetical protein R1sor_027582 [Riccia sorocarpa]|uniref:Uncharacterized protein n=1 Tax=Riccia sorocarpa TaxID=122646 RepID=A0ABD3GIV0_9MARC